MCIDKKSGVRAPNAPGAVALDSIRYKERPETRLLILAASFPLSLIVAFKARVMPWLHYFRVLFPM